MTAKQWSEETGQRYRARTAHYLSYLGLPAKLNERNIRTNVDLAVFEYTPSSERAFCTYVTTGMSEVWQTTPRRKTLFTELIFYWPEPAAWAIDLLVKLAEYPATYQTFFAVGQTLPLMGPIVPGSGLTTLLLLPPLLEESGFRHFHEITARYIEMLWVVPLYEAERQFVIQHDHLALLDCVPEKRLKVLQEPQRAALA